MEDNIYYKIYKSYKGDLDVVCVQWFDEYDYDQYSFITDENGNHLVFQNEEDAKMWLSNTMSNKKIFILCDICGDAITFKVNDKEHNYDKGKFECQVYSNKNTYQYRVGDICTICSEVIADTIKNVLMNDFKIGCVSRIKP